MGVSQEERGKWKRNGRRIWNGWKLSSGSSVSDSSGDPKGWDPADEELPEMSAALLETAGVLNMNYSWGKETVRISTPKLT